MGTIAHAFESGGHTAKEGMFSNLVLLSRVDGKVDPSEIALLEKIARKLSLTKEQASDIMENPEDYRMIPPAAKTERIEQFIIFIQMTCADGEIDAKELKMIHKYGIALGFKDEEVEEYMDEIIAQTQAGNDMDTIYNNIISN